jgi:hypothetical protein
VLAVDAADDENNTKFTRLATNCFLLISQIEIKKVEIFRVHTQKVAHFIIDFVHRIAHDNDEDDVYYAKLNKDFFQKKRQNKRKPRKSFLQI